MNVENVKLNLSGKKVLVTGAEGFIGSHLVEALVEEGCSVSALVLYNSFGSWGWLEHIEPRALKSVQVIFGDVRDPALMQRAIRGCHIVFHLAALIAIPYSFEAPESYVQTNVIGTLNVLQASREARVDKIIHTSTSEVYGTAKRVPIDETHPLEAQSPYAATKIASDQLALSFHRSFDLPVAVIRPFNTYGPRQSARAVIPTIIAQAASGAKSIKLGATWPTRDFNYVLDTVAGFVAVAKSSASTGQVINIGSNFEISIGDVARLIANVMNVRIDVVCEEARLRPGSSEVERLWADNRKALEVTEWEPQFSGRDGLERGIERTVKWFLDPVNLAKYKPDVYNL